MQYFNGLKSVSCETNCETSCGFKLLAYCLFNEPKFENDRMSRLAQAQVVFLVIFFLFLFGNLALSDNSGIVKFINLKERTITFSNLFFYIEYYKLMKMSVAFMVDTSLLLRITKGNQKKNTHKITTPSLKTFNICVPITLFHPIILC